MDGSRPIQLNLQLPAGTLEGLTRLVTELRYLAAAVRGSRAADGALPETGENPVFDPGRFRALEQPAESGTIRLEDMESGPFPLLRLEDAGAGPQPLPRPQDAGPAEAVPLRREAAVRLETPKRAGIPISGQAASPLSRPQGDAWERKDARSALFSLQDLSQALRRDERRYDSGFPLY